MAIAEYQNHVLELNKLKRVYAVSKAAMKGYLDSKNGNANHLKLFRRPNIMNIDIEKKLFEHKLNFESIIFNL